MTPSRFDAFLAGDARAFSPEERAGLRKFIDTGCIACHNGAAVGGGIFQKFGVVEDYWTATGSQQPDKGRFDVTHDPQDTYVFKVPSLRNVAMTPPYFHDGSVRLLPEAVRIMAKRSSDGLSAIRIRPTSSLFSGVSPGSCRRGSSTRESCRHPALM